MPATIRSSPNTRWIAALLLASAGTRVSSVRPPSMIAIMAREVPRV